jgi:hypothetical protein
MKRGILYLMIGLPCAAVVMGIVIVVLAFSNPDPGVRPDGRPLSKTSWQAAE